MGSTLEDLRALVREATHGLPDVAEMKAFGSLGFTVRGAMFALAYRKELRIAVKIPDPVSRASLLAEEGSSVWSPRPGTGAKSSWVLVPEPWHDQPQRLAPWVRRAYEQILHAIDGHSGESAIEILHRGSTTARTLEKRSRKTAAASSPKRRRSGSKPAATEKPAGTTTRTQEKPTKKARAKRGAQKR